MIPPEVLTMTIGRRTLVAGSAAISSQPWLSALASIGEREQEEKLVLSRFYGAKMIMDGAAWRGFSDRVMGGVSNAELSSTRIGGRGCIRLSGNVTRANNGGFFGSVSEY